MAALWAGVDGGERAGLVERGPGVYDILEGRRSFQFILKLENLQLHNSTGLLAAVILDIYPSCMKNG